MRSLSSYTIAMALPGSTSWNWFNSTSFHRRRMVPWYRRRAVGASGGRAASTGKVAATRRASTRRNIASQRRFCSCEWGRAREREKGAAI